MAPSRLSRPDIGSILLKLSRLIGRAWLGIWGFHVQVLYDLVLIAGTGELRTVWRVSHPALLLKPVSSTFLASSAAFS